jgi:V/A-type H+-transporting ATPase subunit B
VRQAKLVEEESSFSVVFAAMGVSYVDAKFFHDEFASSGVLRNVVMFINLADDPPVERLTLPRTALTAAEYLAYDLDRHVLVVMTDMTYYAEALREVATAASSGSPMPPTAASSARARPRTGASRPRSTSPGSSCPCSPATC